MPAAHYPITRVGQYEYLALPFSFESNEVGTFKLATLPYRCKLISAKTAMQKAAGASDTGTVVVKKASTTVATVTVAASAAIGEEDTAPTVTETIFETTDQISITTAKTTAGGKGMLYLTVEVLPSH
jgi:hypothetical protein